MSGGLEVDAARLTSDAPPLVMLGLHSRSRCFNSGEIDVVLNGIVTKRELTYKPISDDMIKMAQYCRRFKTIKNAASATKVHEQIRRRIEAVDSEGNVRKVRRCREFEAAQLINLMPGTVDEAVALIPTLEGNRFLPDLVEEIQPMRDFDREIQ
eukprot:TRINITY_DN43065_c0_g1_i1.p2 TRINITY_DN43065_c0_g1~~TRINITY_DN43065_c0_g1_i1.p2  ORF type:complete len:177 (+),score=23.82 TRINITY_DN43065_c0_g1_i1:72-533(+)